MAARSDSPSWTPDAIRPHLRGALAFPVTPFSGDGSIDLDSVRRNAAFLADSGISAIVAPSGTGEIFALTPDEASAVVAATVEVAGDKPVIAAAGFGPRIGAELARSAEAAGAAAIMIVPPYYGKPDPDALITYYADIAASTSLGIIPYARDAALFSPQMVEQLVDTVPNVVAFKDGRGDVRLFQQIREYVSERIGADRLVWLAGAGDDLVGPYFAAGAEGFTSSLACFWPEAAADLYRLAAAGDYARLSEYHHRVVRPIYALRQRRPGFEVSVMKAAMDILGYKAGPARSPLANLSESDHAELAELLTTLKVPTAAQRASLPAYA
ncbi:MAG: dihydrodipicolinate synthase family protein [Chloroflexota bacterium]|nr:dihydrodipicolinate synthase family protein [Chloroflexota bacterium]